jgi:hypothetical protein
LVLEKPALQVHAELPASEELPVQHVKHTDDDVAPTVEAYLAATQLVQEADPVEDFHFPAVHTTHDEDGPAKPAVHPQAVCAELPAGALLFAGHVKHVEFDVALTLPEYLPEPQLMQTEDEESENFPASQLANCPAPEDAQQLRNSSIGSHTENDIGNFWAESFAVVWGARCVSVLRPKKSLSNYCPIRKFLQTLFYRTPPIETPMDPAACFFESFHPWMVERRKGKKNEETNVSGKNTTLVPFFFFVADSCLKAFALLNNLSSHRPSFMSLIFSSRSRFILNNFYSFSRYLL